MIKKPKIVLVGGGSVSWSPKLIVDLTLAPGLESAQFVILDIDPLAGQKVVAFGRKLSERKGLTCSFELAETSKEAYTGADFVIITISTGGFDAMAHDIKIPEDYGIYQTVGDTVGPGGWARSLRNIPVFAEMAADIQKFAPGAVVLNYTNPMATLTNVFCKTTSLKTVGLCHGVFEVYDYLMKVFSLESEDEIKLRFGGTNHFFWITDLKIRGEDGFELLRCRLKGGKKLDDLIRESYVDSAGWSSGHELSHELFEYYGFLPYIADRHISEFFPAYLTDQKRIEIYKIKRTSIDERRKWKVEKEARLDKYISGEENIDSKRSRETAADIISAMVGGRDFIDVVNLPNEGQIPNLPAGSIVETLGTINALGFTPITACALPQKLLNLVLPHVNNQNDIAEAGISGNREQAMWALYNDPLCSHLTLPQVREMGTRLLEAHREYLPQFFKGGTLL
jgi:alpha-galactosidase/6-phospho-beta-glucosidase family protein